MMPGGHLASSIVLAAGAYAAGSSPQFAAGCVLGGFFIDVDHYVDYLVFEGQWRRPSPYDFLRYYFRLMPKRVVLPLHSWELMTLLTVTAIVTQQPLLSGYVVGAFMHLIFDVLVNGDHNLKAPLKFYSFFYRSRKSFNALALMEPGVSIPSDTGADPYREFFTWKPAWKKNRSKKRT